MKFTLQRFEDHLGCDCSHCFLLILLITNLGVITGHGICSCGRCICQDGWFGKMCQHSRKCNMTEEESRSLCESADGILCSGKGKNWQLSYPMSVPRQRKTTMFWKTKVHGSGLLFRNPCLQRHLLLKGCYIWLHNALTSILSNTHHSRTCSAALLSYAIC